MSFSSFQQFPSSNTQTNHSSAIAKATKTIMFYRCRAINKAGRDEHTITVYRKGILNFFSNKLENNLFLYV